MSGGAEDLVADLKARVMPVDAQRLAIARRHLDRLTKPIGSLGRLETIAAQMFALKDAALEPLTRKAVYVFAADHGVVAEGVSAYPAEVTRQMVLNFLRGGAAINVLARANDVAVRVVDVGVDGDLADEAMLLHEKVRRGSRNMLREPAMSEAELTQALKVGMRAAETAFADGMALVAVGEMGIGNTTAASAMTSLLTGADCKSVTGRGTGVSDEQYLRKQAVVSAILERHSQTSGVNTPLGILRAVGGLEIAAMAGMILAAAAHRIAIVLDGFISTAAAAVACGLVPAARGYLFAGHRSEEPGHRVLLEHLALQPVLDLGMRLGEGTGAVLAMPVIEAAVHLYLEMATFDSAGVSGAGQ